MLTAGMIGFSNNKKGFLPTLIRFFTESKISHAFVIAEPVILNEAVLEASMVVQHVPFEKFYTLDVNQQYWIYNCFKASEEQKKKALNFIYREYAGVHYGKLQLLWFLYRWFCTKILKQDNNKVTKRKNWLSAGVICSELQYEYFRQLGGEYSKLVEDFNQDTIQAEDLRKLVNSRPDLFILITSKV